MVHVCLTLLMLLATLIATTAVVVLGVASMAGLVHSGYSPFVVLIPGVPVLMLVGVGVAVTGFMVAGES